MTLTCAIRIGQTTIAFHCRSQAWLNAIKKHYSAFIIRRARGRVFRVIISGELKPGFDATPLTVRNEGGKWRIKRHDFVSTSSPDYARTTLFAEKNKYAFDSWLRVFLTLCGTKNCSLLLHGAGYIHSRGVTVFPGRSGRGKSTIIRILGKKRALSDELVCVYGHAGEYFAASTPFWGELKKGTGDVYDEKLSSIFFLKKSSGIALESISAREAVKNILKTALFFSRDRRLIEGLIDAARDIVRKVPCGVISFAKSSKKKEILNAITRKHADKERIHA